MSRESEHALEELSLVADNRAGLNSEFARTLLEIIERYYTESKTSNEPEAKNVVLNLRHICAGRPEEWPRLVHTPPWIARFALTYDLPERRERPQASHGASEASERSRSELDRLELQNQLLQSRVAESRRTAARETQRFDQLQVEFKQLREEHRKLQEENRKLQVKLDEFLDRINERSAANDRLASNLMAKADARLRMIECYEGIVEDVDGDKVLVIYDVDGNIVEQTYDKNQFVDGRLPDVGTRLTVFVNVAEVRPSPTESTPQESDIDDELYDPHRKPLRGPLEI